MSEEGRHFTTLGADVPTYIPGGTDINGPITKTKEKNVQEFFFNHPVCMNKDGVVFFSSTSLLPD